MSDEIDIDSAMEAEAPKKSYGRKDLDGYPFICCVTPEAEKFAKSRGEQPVPRPEGSHSYRDDAVRGDKCQCGKMKFAGGRP